MVQPGWTKPHIIKQNNNWWCYQRGNYASAVAHSPSAAYWAFVRLNYMRTLKGVRHHGF